ncbi:DNA starvation/stationary phase protection protein Dps [Tsuneonella amylolytica]|uniref:DNA starvation/stationary phase protection protein Dps n=1 Tax=Tsuneonella amylolytica TaxID=2338327 RepID=UPI000EAAC920|nr:DNA starvation/stationary phase protection protein Dps [Tsuneonella amylolytica]
MPEQFASGVEDNTAKKMIGLLNDRLADGIDLANAVKQAHWNIKGPSFIGIHELLDDVADRMRDHVDTIAERCVILGGIAKGTTQNVEKDSSLKAYPDSIHDQKDHVKELTERFKDFGAKCREAIDTASEAGDEDTADLFTGVSRAVDKDAWFIGAHNAK